MCRYMALETEPEFSDQAEITVEAPKKDSLLNGHIRAKEDGYVMLAVPNENWLECEL